MKRLLLSGATVIAASTFSVGAWADVVCRGHMLDEQGEPMIGAVIMIPGTKIGTNTDVDGYFKLNVPDKTRELKITYVGYSPSSCRCHLTWARSAWLPTQKCFRTSS